MALGLIAEAILRVEHKLDLLLKHLKVPAQQMHFYGNTCPVCARVIDYQIDLQKNVVVRKCGCSTGKQPPTIPLVPVGDPNASTSNQASRRGRSSSAPSAPEEGPASGGHQSGR